MRLYARAANGRSVPRDRRYDASAEQGGPPSGGLAVHDPEALIRWRTEHDISRAEVARQLGVAFSAVERWENGAAVALPELQQRIARLIGAAAPECEKTAEEVPASAGVTPSGRDSAVLGTSVIVTEYIRHSKLSPEALVKLTRELREALR